MLNDYLQKVDCQQCPSDPCVYWKHTDRGLIVIAIHVDDLIIVSNDTQMLMQEKNSLSKRFVMHDLGEAHFIFGMKITRDRQNCTLWLIQEHYLSEVVEKFGLKKCQSVAMP